MLERLMPAPQGPLSFPPADAPLTVVVWQRLRDDIICGKLKPRSRLRIGQLRDMYHTGATPLREALSRLVPEGFVVSLDRRGFMVAPVSLRELRELTDIRKLLEKEAARLSLTYGDDIWESHLVATLHRISKWQSKSAGKLTPAMREWETLHEQFFDTLMGGSQSQWLLSFRRQAYLYAKRYMRVCLPASAIRDLQKDHKAMTDAALIRNIQKLHAVIEDQLERVFREIEASGKL
jgi:GntR family transcriptional regulator, carbon starvation induced regulator